MVPDSRRAMVTSGDQPPVVDFNSQKNVNLSQFPDGDALERMKLVWISADRTDSGEGPFPGDRRHSWLITCHPGQTQDLRTRQRQPSDLAGKIDMVTMGPQLLCRSDRCRLTFRERIPRIRGNASATVWSNESSR